MRFQSIRLVEQMDKNFVGSSLSRKKRVIVTVGLFYYQKGTVTEV